MVSFETFNQWSMTWADFILVRVIDSTIVFLLIGLLWLLLKKWASPQLGYCLFLLVLIKLVIPSPLSIPDLISNYFPFEKVTHNSTGIGSSEWKWFDFFTGSTNGSSKESTSSLLPVQKTPQNFLNISAPGLLMVSWAVIILLLFLRLGRVNWITRRLLKHFYPIDPNNFFINLRELEIVAGLKSPVRWISGFWVKSPMVLGMIRPMIVLPPDLCKIYTPSQLRWILLHELNHIKRCDLTISAAQQVLQILFFFHPLVWWTNAIVNQLREYSCDDAAMLESKTSSKDCSEGFLLVVARINELPMVAPTVVGIGCYKKMVWKRLLRLLDENRKRLSQFSLQSKMLLVVLMAMILPFSGKISSDLKWEWICVSTEGPAQRQGYAMTYDSDREKVVMFGGFFSVTRYMLNDTWEWDGKEWIEVPIDPANRPEARFLMTMVYDSSRKKAMMYGGADVVKNKGFDDTWEYDGKIWKKISVSGPEMRWGHGMVYDTAHEKVLLFGGGDKDWKPKTDFWEYDGNTWSRIVLEKIPPPRMLMFMTYDSYRQKLVLFGGTDGEKLFGDTWEWDGIRFIKVAETGPEKRMWGGMTYDPSRKKVILIGGGTDLGDEYTARDLNDTWEWDGNRWTQIKIFGPEPREIMTITYDLRRKKTLMFGGIGHENGTGRMVRYGDTWEFGQ